MAGKIVKLSDEELTTCKLRDITNAVKEKLTKEELEQLKATTDEKARRELVISFYKKYIDEVIADVDSNTPAANEGTTPAGEKEGSDAGTTPAPATDAAPVVAATSETTAKDVNINVYFTVSVKGVTGYSGTVTCSCEHLLKVAFLNPKTAIIEFRTKDRAKQFIDIVKKVDHVKGLSSIPENTRVLVINRVKEINELK